VDDPDALTLRSLAADAGDAPDAGGSAADVAADLARVEADGPPFLVAVTAEVRARLGEVAAATSWSVRRGNEPVAAVRAVRLRWDGTSSDAPAGGAGEAVARAGEDGADTLAVLDVRVAAEARGQGIGGVLLARTAALAADVGCRRTLVLLRPHAKAAHPLTPFVRYLAAVRDDGQPFDPWLRVAWRAGLQPVRSVDRSLVASAPLVRWSAWSGRRFPTSGPELVPGAIKPTIVEFERGEGRYREPHLWAASRADLAVPAPGDAGWVAALAHVGIVPGDRAHREVKRRRA
jgi:GNAT superfamily N-acetyltransferase